MSTIRHWNQQQIAPRALYRWLYRELSFQKLEAAQIQKAEQQRREETLAKYKKQEYKPPGNHRPSKRLCITGLYDSIGLRENFLKNDDVMYGKEILEYLKSQRVYKELFARYNGKDFEDEERLRLTARRVGMELPVNDFKSRS